MSIPNCPPPGARCPLLSALESACLTHLRFVSQYYHLPVLILENCRFSSERHWFCFPYVPRLSKRTQTRHQKAQQTLHSSCYKLLLCLWWLCQRPVFVLQEALLGFGYSPQWSIPGSFDLKKKYIYFTVSKEPQCARFSRVFTCPPIV